MATNERVQDAAGDSKVINMLRRDAAAVVPTYRSQRVPAFPTAPTNPSSVLPCPGREEIHCDVTIVWGKGGSFAHGLYSAYPWIESLVVTSTRKDSLVLKTA
jgi:hypothetical protein